MDSDRVQTGDPPWLKRAFQELGEHEIAGRTSNPDIERFLQSTVEGPPGHMSDETAWCSAFVNCMIEDATLLEGTNSVAARSWLDFGKAIKNPVRGCIVVFSRPDAGPAFGHVAFFLRKSGDTIRVIGGNQSDSVSISEYAASRLLGYRLPKEVDVTKEELRSMLRDGFSPGFDTVNEWAAQLNQVRRDVEQIKKDVAAIKKAPGVVKR
jgi:uncharacterized protein (TIGR02594 family)